MTFAETLTDAERGFGRRSTIYSALCGCIAEMALDTGAIIVVYIAMLGGDDATKMLATGFTPVATVFFGLFFGGICDRFGLRRAMSTSCIGAFAAFVMMAAAPMMGAAKLGFFLGACFLYCLTRPLYTACWYPILDNFLRPCDRGRFFATMRFCYSTLNACLMFALGRLMASMGGHPPLWLMQSIILLCGFGNLGRMYFANRAPLAPEFRNPPLSAALRSHGQKYSLKEGLRISFRNAPLVGFCVYFCLYNVVVTSYIPLAVVYMKSDVFNAEPSSIMFAASLSLAGSLVGYLLSNRILKALGTKKTILFCHVAGVLLPAALFLCEPTNPHRLLLVDAVQFLAAFVGAEMMVVNSVESLALARPGNKTIALALCQVFCAVGTAVGRFGVTGALACGLLAPAWVARGFTVTKFQSIFAVDAVMMVFFLVLLVLLPAFVPKHEDYYEP